MVIVEDRRVIINIADGDVYLQSIEWVSDDNDSDSDDDNQNNYIKPLNTQSFQMRPKQFQQSYFHSFPIH